MDKETKLFTVARNLTLCDTCLVYATTQKEAIEKALKDDFAEPKGLEETCWDGGVFVSCTKPWVEKSSKEKN